MAGTTLSTTAPVSSPRSGDPEGRGGLPSPQATARWAPVRTLLDLTGLLLLMLALGSRAQAFTGFPEGDDAWGHLAKTRFVLDSWPHISWNYQWFSGQPSFGSQPPGYHLLVAAIAAVADMPVTTAMNLAAAAGVFGIVLGVYGTVRAVSGSRAAALLAGAALLGAPTLWAQAVTYGLYPRLLGLSAVALAVAGAARIAVRGGRFTMLGTSVALAAGLSMHPVVGMAGTVLVAGLLLVGSWWDVVHRAGAAAAMLVLTGGLSAYFYLPLVLLPRAQDPRTDQEDPLTPAMLVWDPGTDLVGLSPVLLPLAAAVVALAVAGLRRPRVPIEDKIALGTDVTFLATTAGASLPDGASPQVRALAAWRSRMAETGYPLRAVVVLAAGVPVVLAYGFVGYLVPRFPYSVNGLQPVDLLVYPAWLLACVLGVGLGLVLHRRRGWDHRRLRTPLLAALAVLALGGLVGTAAALPTGARDNGSRETALRAVSGLPDDTHGHQHRVAVNTDATSSVLNAVSTLPQTRGYRDHGNLQQDYQVWLETALTGDPAESDEVRHFLLDWNAVGTVLADPTAAPLDWARADPRLTEAPATASPFATFAVRDAGAVVSATRAPTVLVVGDQQHYDLVLRALAQADVGSDELVPLRGPEGLAGTTADDLAPFDTVLLYGGDLGDADDAATALRRYTALGGHVVVADSDTDGPTAQLLRADHGLLPVSSLSRRTVIGSWDWRSGGGPALTGVDTDAFGAPSYAGSGSWEVQAGELSPAGRAVLRSGRSVVTATRGLGRGSVTWEGFALPYHAADQRAAAEGRLLGNLLGATPTRPVRARARFVSSEHRTVVVGPRARGVLVKEHLAPDWHATTGGRELPIRSAGPGMMWVQLPEDHGRMRIVLDYRLGGVERAGLALSLTSLVVLLTLLAAAVVARPRRRVAPRA